MFYVCNIIIVHLQQKNHLCSSTVKTGHQKIKTTDTKIFFVCNIIIVLLQQKHIYVALRQKLTYKIRKTVETKLVYVCSIFFVVLQQSKNMYVALKRENHKKK